MVTTPVGDSVVAKRVYRNCPTILSDRVTHVELVELDMVDLDVILGMDLLNHFLLPFIVELELLSSIFLMNSS